MELLPYMDRIKYLDTATADDETFIRLHEHHIFHVPFENLDVRYRRIFNLEPESIHKKVVDDLRGGFCYELNILFSWLLTEIGLRNSIISSRIFDDNGNPGPEFDHMSLHVRGKRSYLADVGFGDLFVRPLEIRHGTQFDGRNYFKIEGNPDETMILLMSPDGNDFRKKYSFTLKEVPRQNFDAISLYKQTSPESYFVKNTICTMPTLTGRLTLFNDKLIERRGNQRIETIVESDEHLKSLLKKHFGIQVLEL